ncbi:MAG: hypothetical protein IKT40_13675 [Bacilli bacterium]|nr:hypothetical protein [Bacilli bacterium]
MGYKRAEWRSGLTYKQVCDQCNTLVVYQDDKLDFRPWYADGFVYCPVCKKPLRHNEKYAENYNRNIQTFEHGENKLTELFCSKCGKKYLEEDCYCSKCGNKRK